MEDSCKVHFQGERALLKGKNACFKKRFSVYTSVMQDGYCECRCCVGVRRVTEKGRVGDEVQRRAVI